ncbi:MAG: FG-GAP repeat protein [Alphaproteobacteria bacterium]
MHKLASLGQHGFSLMQTGVILAVSSIALAAALPNQQFSSDTKKEEITQARMRVIDAAMKQFIASNSRLPCPANAQLAFSNASYGIENSAPGTCNSPSLGPVNEVVGGSVPTRALGIADDYALDGYGRRFTYIVDRNTTSTSECRDRQSQGTKGTIEILDAYNSTLHQDKVMWALVSYGKDGHGAYPAIGSTAAGRMNVYNSDNNTLYNAWVNSAFTLSFTGKLVNMENSSTYDDKIWISKELKNTCCLGPRCNLGVLMETKSDSALDIAFSLTFTVGDLTGDGIDDVVYSNPNTSELEVVVVSGKTAGWPVPPTTTSAASEAAFTIGMDLDAANSAVSLAIGDVTADGIPDLLLNSAGYAYIIHDLTTAIDIFGDEMYLSEIVDSALATPIAHYGSGPPGAAMIANIDGDEYNDLLITPYALNNYLMVVFGRPNGDWPESIDLFTEGLDSHFLIASLAGRSFCALQHGLSTGDINNDGYDDIVTGGAADWLDLEGGGMALPNRGTMSVIYGRDRGSWPTGVPALYDADNTIFGSPHGAVFLTTLAGDGFMGQSVDVVDINGDGYDDMITNSTHRVYGVFGQSGDYGVYTGNDMSAEADFIIDLVTNRPAGAANLVDYYGIVKATDLNNDGLKDIVLHSAKTTLSNSNSGVSYVLYAPKRANGWAADGWGAQYTAAGNITLFTGTGGYGNLSGANGFIVEGAPNDYLYHVGFGDMNGDGLNDFVYAAPGFSDDDTGALYLLNGRRNTEWFTRYDSTYNWLPKVDARDYFTY